ncbi:response regulator [Cohnella cellulosilytica]|uniref:Response regulator n=1 Tax=Cohnella cellulosilytica TaxID=986710 RepID=A0ABW2FJ72_9BACL
MKIAVVDDEERIRGGLAKLVEQAGAQYEVVAVCSGAADLLERIEAGIVPELVMTDIKMPGMNGLELIDALRGAHPEMRYAVISGFDDFVFAKQAMRYGVEDYLLKPVDPQELAEMLARKHAEIEEQARRSSAEFEKRLRLLLVPDEGTVPGHLREEAVREMRDHPLFREAYAVVRVRTEPPAPPKELNDALAVFGRQWRALEMNGALTVIAPIRPDDHYDTIRERGQTLMQRLSALRHVRVGASEPFRGPVRLAQAAAQAETALHRAWFEPGRHAFADHLHLTKAPEPAAHPFVLFDRASRAALTMSDWDGFNEALVGWWGEWMRAYPSWDELREGCEGVLALLGGQEPFDPRRHADRQACAAAFFAAVHERFRRLREQRQESRVVETVKAYIAKHYAEEIELCKIADEVYLTPSYLSKLFRTETGETITDYLIFVRMERAKALLRERAELKTYEVGERVGYTDPAYFNKAFKRATGCTPKEFRDRVR